MTDETRSQEGITAAQRFKEDVIEGLTKEPKSLPCKYFYDDRGSQLFEKITTLEEYYPTRTELAIMQENLGEIAASIGKDVNLIEFGSGSSIKTELLLAHANIRSYIPIDIAEEALLASADRIGEKHPELAIHPIASDYTEDVHLPKGLEGSRNVVYFPGSTIGNFEPKDAARFLDRTRRMMGSNGALLIGVDLQKDKSIIDPAYNDERGVTAEFNLNLLARLNRELKPQPELLGFSHSAFYNEPEGRIEMHLIANADSTHSLDGACITFKEGEHILTEYSYKYTIPGFTRLAQESGLQLMHSWVDKASYFAVLFFEPFNLK
jgi:dimethylhistidine N-methyltransferase